MPISPSTPRSAPDRDAAPRLILRLGAAGLALLTLGGAAVAWNHWEETLQRAQVVLKAYAEVYAQDLQDRFAVQSLRASQPAGLRQLPAAYPHAHVELRRAFPADPAQAKLDSGTINGVLDPGQPPVGGAWVRVPGQTYTVLATVPRQVLVEQWERGLLPYVLVLAMLGSLGAALTLLGTQRMRQLRRQSQDTLRTLSRISGFQAFRAKANELIAGSGQESDLLQAICNAAIEISDVRLACIGRADAAGRGHVLAAAGARGYLDGLTFSVDARVPEGRGPFGRAWRSVEAQFNADFQLADNAPWAERAAAHGLRASAALPIRRHGRLDAVLCLYWGEPMHFDPEFQSVVREVGEDLSRGLERLDLIAAQQEALRAHERQGELMRTVFSQIDVLIASRNEGELLDTACTRLLEGGLFVAAWIAQPDGQGLVRVAAAAGETRAMLEAVPLQTGPDSQTALARTWRTGMKAIDSDPQSPLLQPWQAYALPGAEQEAITLPIRRSGALWGVLVLVATDGADLDAIVQDTLLRTAELIGQALTEIDLKQLLQQRESEQAHLARHDALTGLANRLALEQHLPHAMARARRSGYRLAIGVLDLDDFKPVNDNYGHAAGDRLLQELAARLQTHLRGSDLLARLGGDEFVLVFDELSGPHPRQVLGQILGRLHRAVEAPFEIAPGVQAEVGMSMGLALYPEDGTEADTLLRQADAALYAVKAGKSRRQQWWLLSGEQVDDDRDEEDIEGYGEAAAALLSKVQDELLRVPETFATELLETMRDEPASARVLNMLGPDEAQALHQRQIAHLRRLLDPALERRQHAQNALRLGRTHAAVGLDGATAMAAMSQFGAALHRATQRLPLRLDARVRLQTILQERLTCELQNAQRGALEIEHERQTHLASMEAQLGAWEQSGQLPRHVVAHLARLEGICGVACGRPDADNRYVLEFAAGEADAYLQSLREIGQDLDFQRGPLEHAGATQRAWSSGAITTEANEARVQSFTTTARRFGIRSSAAIPLLDRGGHVHQVISLLGRYPGQFDSPGMRMWLESAQHHLSPAFQRVLAGQAQQPIAATRRSHLHELLYSGGLRLYVQPLVNLVSGEPDGVEVLARLQDGDTVLSPGAFLEAFGNHELRILFRRGLEMTLRWLRTWDAQGLHVDASLNLPPSVLIDPECANWIAHALAESAVEAKRLHLELLETHEDQFDSQRRDAAIASLSRLGVRLIMDDLGSGYSSLRRMRSLPFHTVKIDQQIVQQAQDDPTKTIAFVGALVRMAQGLGMQVTMEGLEAPDLVEMALALGVEHGQGYALSHPMPAERLAEWMRQWHWRLDAANPATALGRQALLFSRDVAPLDWQRIIASHLQYRETLMRSLRGEGVPLQWRVVCRDDACLLGRWMRRQSAVIWPEVQPLFGHAQRLHAEFHRKAGDLLRRAEEDHDTDEVLDDLAGGALDRISDRLVGALHQLNWSLNPGATPSEQPHARAETETDASPA